MKKFFVALEVLTILLIGGFLLLVYSGWYNISASVPHYGIMQWTLETTMENSVRRHAGDIAAPDLQKFDPRQGLQHFDEMCVLCHGAPGVEPSEIGQGITPEPPELSKAVRQWNPSELFWIVSNGIKMSGMPGFGPTHSEEEIWAIVAFIRRLPETTPEEYQSLVQQLPAGGHGQGPGEGHGAGEAGGGHAH